MEIERYDPFDGKLGFALASRLGDMVNVSGMTAVDAQMQVPEGMEEQMRLAYANAANILRHYGAALDRVVEQVLFFVGEEAPAFEAYQRVRADSFGDAAPAATMVGVIRLVDPRYRIEVKVTAAL